MMQNRQFPLAILFALMLLVAIFFSLQVNSIGILIVAEVFAVAVAVWTLGSNLPRALRHASEGNCRRMDGSHSSRRESKERRAHRKLYLDILGGLVVVTLITNAALTCVHLFVVPLPLATEAVSLFSPNGQQWKAGMKSSRVDSRYEQWSQSTRRHSARDANQSGKLIWSMAPVLAIATLAVGLLVGGMIRFTYFRALAEFRAGVAQRSEVYTLRDLSRISEHGPA